MYRTADLSLFFHSWGEPDTSPSSGIDLHSRPSEILEGMKPGNSRGLGGRASYTMPLRETRAGALAGNKPCACNGHKLDLRRDAGNGELST